MATSYKTICVLLLSVFSFASCDLLDEPVTEKEAVAFAKEIETSLANKNPTLVNEILDARAFARKVEDASGGKIEHSQLSTLPNDLRKRRLGSEIIASNGEGGTYQLVKHYEKEGKQHLAFRMYGASGLNYHDIELVRSLDKIKAADIYIFVSGETFSKMVADVIQDINTYYKGKPGEQQKSGTETFRDIRKLMSAQKYSEAKSKYDSLPQHFKEQKNFQLINVLLTSEIDDEQYKQALQSYTTAFPGEANVPLMFIDHHILQEDYKAALADVDKLDSIINKDPFLDFYRGNIYNTMDDTARAIQHYERLNKTMPAFTDGVIELAAIYLKVGNDEKARKLLSAYKGNKQLDEEKLETIRILYPDFNF